MDFDIQRLRVFASLHEEHIKLLETLIETITCKAGEAVIRQDAPAEYFYIILKGKVQISYKPYDGNSITVSHVEEGGLFGWSAVVGSKRYTSSAIVIESLEAVRIRGDELRKLSAEHPEVGQEILNSLANAVSARWENAHEEVRLMLEKGMK